MKIRAILLLVLAGAFAALSVYAAIAAQREYTAYRAGTTWGVAEFQDYKGGTLALSQRSNQYWLNGCLRAVTSIEGRLLYGENRTRLQESCNGIVDTITKASPNNAYAWYFQAYLAHQYGSDSEFNAALLKSYESGPTEQWIAELRVPLAERRLASLNEQALKGHQNDLGLLVQSRRGIGSIARRYVRDSDFRARITDVVETLPQTAQQHFLRILKVEVARFRNDG
jgi:hypothetical protein